MTSKTSAIVLSHNYGRYLAQCLESLLVQTLPFDEILVVDDASSDETAAIARKYQPLGVKYLRTEWRNQEAARDSGFHAASGGFLVFVDADDWLAHDYHEKMLRVLQDHPSAGFAYCGAHLAKEGISADWFPGHQHPLRLYCFFDFWHQNPVATAPIIRREAWPSGPFHHAGSVSENGKIYGEDWERFLTLLHRGWNSVLMPERLVFYRIHAENTSLAAVSDPVLEEKAKWQIREKFYPYELTLLFLLGRGRQEGLKTLRSLAGMKLPEHTQIIVVHAFQEPFRLPPPFIGRFEYCPKAFTCSDSEWKLKALEQTRSFARGKEVLLVSDRILLNRDTFEILKKEKSRARADLYSAHTSGSLPGTARAWRSAGADPWQGVIPVPVTKKPKRVLAAGLDLTLIDSKTYHDRGLFSLAAKTPFEPLELAMGIYARKKHKRWFARGMSRTVAGSNRRPDTQALFHLPADHRWPEISIVIPVKNNRENLRALLLSLAEINYPREKFEILVVDNGSTDGSAETAAAFSGVRVLRETSPGSYHARNRGIRESARPFIAFVDSDCTVTRGWLQELAAPMLEDSGIGAVGGPNLARHPEALVSRLDRKAGVFCNYPGRTGGQPSYAITMNMLYRKEVFETCGFFDASPKSGSDVEMCWRMQRENRWQLRLLEKSAWVTHKDPESALPYIKRHWRIGTGHDTLFAQYPEHRTPLYFWMPKTWRELILQSFKQLLAGLFSKTQASKTELLLKTLRHFLLKAGALSRAKVRWREQKKESCRETLIYFGKETSPRESAAFSGLLRQARQNVQVLYVTPSANHLGSLTQSLLAAAGGTTRWEWAPGFESFQLWKFPFFSDAANNKFQALRILKAVRGENSKKLILSGDLSAEALRNWQKLLGKEKTYLAAPQNFRLSEIHFPAVGSLLPEGAAQFLDLDYYQKLSALSVWPVVLAGLFSAEEQQLLESSALGFPNLFILSFKTAEEIRLADELFSAAVTAWKTSPPARLEEETSRLLSGFTGPRLHLSPESLSLQHKTGYTFASSEEALRWLGVWQKMPGWDWEKIWLRHEAPPDGTGKKEVPASVQAARENVRKLDAVSALP